MPKLNDCPYLELESHNNCPYCRSNFENTTLPRIDDENELVQTSSLSEQLTTLRSSLENTPTYRLLNIPRTNINQPTTHQPFLNHTQAHLNHIQAHQNLLNDQQVLARRAQTIQELAPAGIINSSEAFNLWNIQPSNYSTWIGSHRTSNTSLYIPIINNNAASVTFNSLNQTPFSAIQNLEIREDAPNMYSVWYNGVCIVATNRNNDQEAHIYRSPDNNIAEEMMPRLLQILLDRVFQYRNE